MDTAVKIADTGYMHCRSRQAVMSQAVADCESLADTVLKTADKGCMKCHCS